METNYTIPGFENRGHTAIITIPGFTTNLIGVDIFFYNLAELCAAIEMDEDIRVVIITAPEEKTHQAGSGAKEPLSSTPREERSALLPRLSESIAGLDRPTIAAIHGDAFGQGLELAMVCDMRIASESSRFGLPHIYEGLVPQDGGTQMLPRLVGKGKALEMILTGELINAGEALRTGLVNIVQSSGNVMKKALELARDMASKAPIALRFAREAIYKGMDLTLDQGLRMEGDLYLLLYSTHDRVHGIVSFKKKEKPSFQGK
jgi:enoyl-CoA hydratase/carnithine racemase